MASMKVTRDYFLSSQNALLVPNRDFGRRKYLHVQGMSKQTSFARWAHDQGQRDGVVMRSLNKQWVHPPEALLRGHIVYNVKFLGEVSVDQPKGTEVVRDAIRKMKFSKQIRKAEGQKVSKVELTISADGVTVQDPKTKHSMHQYPLHRISYCADDKADKRMFTFIAKVTDSTKHLCYVFDSEKCAEEITLTVGQAFDLAYRRFLETSGKDMDTKKQFLLMQKKVQTLQQENDALKKRITELEKLKDQTEVDAYKQTNKIPTLTVVSPSGGGEGMSLFQQPFLPQKPERIEAPVVGRKLENLIFEDNFTPLPQTNGSLPLNNNKMSGPVLSPPPPVTKPRSASSSVLLGSPSQPSAAPRANDAFGASPFGAAPAHSDPFGMGAFNPSSNDLDREIHNVNLELLDLQAGFSQGLSFGTEDFSLDDLDPLKAK